ncbi:DnaJ-domain-containing protein [Cystobasidium minutum MCA 4210]|uniref:DnaJ-domain-containing protein n=1 Tax=Cystobasidium minutum MCA 4210 TaxID=1397322 RepID=UPI0034CF743F|eukprot:jgi/Rhomi1/174468/fgenesh1_kg.8_\
MVASTELYDVLELPPTCSAAEIKSAYRRLAMLHHPDKNAGASHEKFQAIQGAYEVLIDPEQRAAYDRYGSAGSKPSEPGPGAGFSGGFNFDDFFGPSFDEDFFFGGGRGYGRAGPQPSRKRRKTRGDDQKVELVISLEEAYTGQEKTFEIEKQVICGKCEGSGCKTGLKARSCGACNGQGVRVEEQSLGPGFVTRRQVTCGACRGEGEVISSRDACKKCKGSKTVKQKKTVTAYVERGARSGDRIVLRGEGEQYPGQQAGDIILIIKTKPHPTFSLIPGTDDLQVSVSINLTEALLGFERVLLTHLDGRGLRVTSPSPGSPGHRVYGHGDEVTIRGEGFPGRRSHLTGDLIVTILVEMPTADFMTSLTDEQRLSLQSGLPPKRPSIETQDLIEDVQLGPIKTKQNRPAEGEGSSHSPPSHDPGICHQQ